MFIPQFPPHVVSVPKAVQVRRHFGVVRLTFSSQHLASLWVHLASSYPTTFKTLFIRQSGASLLICQRA